MPLNLKKQFKTKQEFEDFIAKVDQDDLRRMVMHSMCHFITIHHLNPQEHGFWYSLNTFILFSLQQICDRAEQLSHEMHIDRKLIKIEIFAQNAEVLFHYPLEGHIHTEKHDLNKYITYQEDLFNFLAV